MKGIKERKFYVTSLLPIFFSAILFPATWFDIAKQWLAMEQDNSHAFPAFVASLFIAFTTQYKLNYGNAMRQVISFIGLAITIFTYQILYLVNIELVLFALIIIGTTLLYFTFFGVQNWLKTGLIISLLCMALPVWDVLLEPLVVVASSVVTSLVHFFNITILIEGNSITTPFGRILIAEGCSGIRYLMVSVVLSLLISHLNQYNFRASLFAVLMGALIGLVANWVRITLLVLIGYYSEMQNNLMQDHEFFGWLVFAFFIMPSIYFAPHMNNTKTNVSISKRNTSIRPIIIISLFALLSYAISTWLFYNLENNQIEQNAAPKNWQLSSQTKVLSSLPIPLSQQLTWYSTRERDIFVGTLTNIKNTQANKLVPYIPQSLVNDSWFSEHEHQLTLDSHAFSGHILKSFENNKRFARAQLFHVGPYWTSNYAHAKLMQIPALLTSQNQFTYYLFLAECKTTSCKTTKENISTEIEGLLRNDP